MNEFSIYADRTTHLGNYQVVGMTEVPALVSIEFRMQFRRFSTI